MLNLLRKIFTKDNSAIKEAISKGAVIVDVRSFEEFKLGHISGSQNIPLNEIRKKLKLIKGWDKPVITVCHSGRRSAVAKSVLTEAGVEVYNGGSWTQIKNIME